MITGAFTDDEVDNLKTVFNAGALDVSPQVQSQRVVGASLGQATISKGAHDLCPAVRAGHHVGHYERLGVVAMVSLRLYGLIFGVLIIFGATLTLPGIVGLVLTVGMAVDANTIFERMREEMVKTSTRDVY